jgi:hypothetical protein
MLWTGQLLSNTGTQIGGLAYPLLILALTHSAVIAGAVGRRGRSPQSASSCPPGRCRTGSAGG